MANNLPPGTTFYKSSRKPAASCPAGKELNPETGRCRVSCKAGYFRNATTGRCNKVKTAKKGGRFDPTPSDEYKLSVLNQKIPQLSSRGVLTYKPVGDVVTETVARSASSGIGNAIDRLYKKINTPEGKAVLAAAAERTINFLKGLTAPIAGAALTLYIGTLLQKKAEATLKIRAQQMASAQVDAVNAALPKSQQLNFEATHALLEQYTNFYLPQLRQANIEQLAARI